MPVLRGDAFWVELHAMHGIALVLKAHDHAVGNFRGDFERIRQARPLDDQGMITSSGEILRESGEYTLTGVMHFGQLAMHERRGAHDATPIDLADGLMTETDAKDRHLRPGACNQIEADPRAIRSTSSTVILSLR